MSGNFGKGSVVRLKSGGPQMTVRDVVDGGWAVCDWFDGKEAKTANFQTDQLDLVDQSPKTMPVRRGPPPRSGGGSSGSWMA
jgi:uncharacterized protein YodC (DUF2158 family)